MPMLWPFGKPEQRFLIKLKTLLLYDSAIVILALKTYVCTKTSTWMFISALSLIGKTWKQQRCLLVGGWVNKLCNLQAMLYYPVQNGMLPPRQWTAWENYQGGSLDGKLYWKRSHHGTWLQLCGTHTSIEFFPNKQVKKRQTDGTSFNNIFILLNVSQLVLFQRKFHWGLLHFTLLYWLFEIWYIQHVALKSGLITSTWLPKWTLREWK